MDYGEAGAAAEDEACDVLRSRGYRIIARNWRTRLGEIDIVARDGDVLVFVEVKSRSGSGFGGAEGAVGLAKRRRLAAVAGTFLAATGCELASRFDVVALEGDEIRVVRDAFSIEDVWPSS